VTEARQRLLTGIALITGPALFFIDNLVHPEEVSRGNEATQLAVIADSPDRWQIAHLIGFVSLLFIVAAIVGLAWFVARDRPRLGIAGGALGIAGALALAFAFALDGFTWGVLGDLYGRPELDRETLVAALTEVQGSAWALPYYVLIVAWVAGMVILAWGAAARIGVRAATLLGLGAVLVGFEGAVADNAYFIASSGVLLVGGIDAGVAIIRQRSSDEALPV
jgi:hypothetical protein